MNSKGVFLDLQVVLGQLFPMGPQAFLGLAQKTFAEDIFYFEKAINIAYERSNEKETKLFFLEQLLAFSETIDRDFRLKGSPHKFWSEVLLRVFMKYAELGEGAKANAVIERMGKSAAVKTMKDHMKALGLHA